jgi:NADPH-dependent 2,4-dienoyl-CoA reductase/sulfur reductase-like enzyme
LFTRARDTARGAIAHRMGGYKHPVHHDDPTRPREIPGEPPRVAVVGAGVAGLSAAAVLAQRTQAYILFYEAVVE